MWLLVTICRSDTSIYYGPLYLCLSAAMICHSNMMLNPLSVSAPPPCCSLKAQSAGVVCTKLFMRRFFEAQGINFTQTRPRH
jgi:hypothetical protein